MRKNIVLAVTLAILLGGAAGIAIVRSNAKTDQTATTVNCAPKTAEYVCYAGEDSKNALTLLKDKNEVVTKDTSFGAMVTSINGKAADDQHYWAFYVNDVYASTGADAYTTKNGEKVEWKLEEIKPL